MSEDTSHIQKNDELTAIMDLSTRVKQGNILLYSVRIIYSKVGRILWITRKIIPQTALHQCVQMIYFKR